MTECWDGTDLKLSYQESYQEILTGNITPEGGNSQVQISTSHIQLHSLNTVIPTALLEALRGGGGGGVCDP